LGWGEGDGGHGWGYIRPLSRATVINPAGCGQIRLVCRRAVTNPAGGGANNFF